MNSALGRVAARARADLWQPLPGPATETPLERSGRRSPTWSRLLERLRWPFFVYAGSRLLLLVVALVNGVLQHSPLLTELTNWDGIWYIRLAEHGYPKTVVHAQTTLGFLPLYPMLMWLVSHILFCGAAVAGLIISGVGGLVATVLVERLAESWWGREGARRAVLFFCFFPGSVVFSMVYSEGVLIPLVAGCLIALQHRRWLVAGLLAASATAVGPNGVPIIVVCAFAALFELRRRGWRDTTAWRSLLAPLLAPVGLIAFGLFLWTWTGSPFASLVAQRDGWGERTDALALFRQGKTLASEISFTHFNFHLVNLNLVIGLLGVIVLVAGLVQLLQRPRQVSFEARVWAFGIAVLTVTSEFVPPNPRVLITGFPLLLVIAQRLSRRGFNMLLATSTLLLVILSAITYVGIALRP
jgi:hypothetical protein